MEDALHTLYRRQTILADFGDFALQSDDLDEVLTEACRLVAAAMNTQRAKILEINAEDKSLLVRAGIGWGPEVVGKLRMSMSEASSETYAIAKREPVIVQNATNDDRFAVPDFMRAEGIVALANVPILLPGNRAYGLLQIDDTKARAFDRTDTEFLRTYAAILGPVIDRLFKVRALSSSEERFRLTVQEATDYAIFVADAEDRITDWLPGAENVFGWSEKEILGRPGSVLFTDEDRANGEDKNEIETARRDGFAPNVRWHQRKDGSRVFIDGPVRALRNKRDGAVTGFLKIGQDVTERRAWQDQQQVLVAELQHRTRNLMAVVSLIADQTLRSSSTLTDFAEAYRSRISALGRVQGLLSRLGEGERVTFDQLLDSELDALAGRDEQSRITLEGPPGVQLRSGTVQILAMAIHELFTNAIKHGALSQPSATLIVRWWFDEQAGRPWIHIEWRESGVSMALPSSITNKYGSGRELIERALPYQLGARTSFQLLNDGLHCTIAMPVSQINVPDNL